VDEPLNDSYDCPTGLAWLNPLAIVNIMKCLFIPSEADLNGLSELWGDVSGKMPFSVAWSLLNFIPSTLSRIMVEIDFHSAYCRPLLGDIHGNYNLPGDNWTYNPTGYSTCAIKDNPGLAGFISTVRSGIVIAMYIGAAWSLTQKVGETIK
jgi:hypothetical protein